MFLLSVLALTGCVGGPVAETPPLTGAQVTSSAIEGADGTRLPLVVWRPEGPPRAVILALHGYGDTGSGTYQWAAQDWARRGIVTYAYDQRGFGANPDRKRWPGADRLIADARAVAEAVRKAEPGLPLLMVGHSMGGGVTLAAAGAPGLEVDGLVLAAPAIAGGSEFNPIHRAGGWGLALLFPDRRFTGENLPETVELFPTDDIERLRTVVTETGHFADPAGRDLYGLVRLMDRAAKAAPQVDLPTMTLMGAEDDYLRARGVLRTHMTIPGRRAYRLYPQGWHWLFRSRASAQVWRDVADFALSLGK